MSSALLLSTLIVFSTGISASNLLDLSLNFPPFEKATSEAKTEFATILSNETLTKGQLETEIKAWATRNNVTEAVNAAQTKDEQRTREIRGNLTKAVNELPALIAKLNAIEDDKSLTMEGTKEKIEAELKGISTPYVKEMIEAIGERMEEDENSQSSVNFSLGR